MQTTLALRARRLLVGAGAITVVLTALAPAAVSASQPDLPPQAVEDRVRGHGAGAGQGPAAGPRSQHVVGSDAHQVLVCHATSAAENPWVLTLVDAHSVDLELQTHGSHDGDVFKVLDEPLDDDADLAAFCADEDSTIVDDNKLDDDSDSDDDDESSDDDDESNDDDDAQGDDDAQRDGGGNQSAGGADPDVDPGSTPGQTAVPAPVADGPRPPLSIHISTDSVTPEVLGATTTRIPTGVTALDASSVEAVAASVPTPSALTSLPATGASSVQVLGLVGGLLILAGGGLELVARRRTSPLAGAHLG